MEVEGGTPDQGRGKGEGCGRIDTIPVYGSLLAAISGYALAPIQRPSSSTTPFDPSDQPRRLPPAFIPLTLSPPPSFLFLSLSLSPSFSLFPPLCSFSRLYLPVFLPSPRFLFMPLLLALLSLPFAFMSPRPRHYRGTLHTANAHDYRIGGIMADTAGNARVDFDSGSMRDGWASILVDRVDSLKWRLRF